MSRIRTIKLKLRFHRFPGHICAGLQTLEKVTKAHVSGLVRHPSDACVSFGKLAVHKHFADFLCSRIRQAESLFCKVNVEHGQYRKGRASYLVRRRMRLSQLNQFGPRKHRIYLIKKLERAPDFIAKITDLI